MKTGKYYIRKAQIIHLVRPTNSSQLLSDKFKMLILKSEHIFE